MPTYQIQLRTDTTASWEAENPVLLRGEMGLEECDNGTRLFKLGNGMTAWAELPYTSGPPGLQGEPGIQGKTGAQGAQGSQGVAGPQGTKGDTPPLSNSTTSTSEVDAASSLAVKTAYDKGALAQNAASAADAKAVAAQNAANTADAKAVAAHSAANAADAKAVAAQNAANTADAKAVAAHSAAGAAQSTANMAVDTKLDNDLRNVSGVLRPYLSSFRLECSNLASSSVVLLASTPNTMGTASITLNSDNYNKKREIRMSADYGHESVTYNQIVYDGFSLRPNGGSQALGNTPYRWSQLFCNSGTIDTSDARKKTLVILDSESLMLAWSKINFTMYQMNDAIQEKGSDKARIHSGIIAQQIKESFESEGLDPFRYGLLCYDEWDAKEEETREVTDKDGITAKAITAPAREAGNLYSLRYSECLCVEAMYQRWRVAKLEARLATAESRLNNLEHLEARLAALEAMA